MTRTPLHDPNTSRTPSSRAHRTGWCAMAVVAALGLSACDTVARINFDDRQFNRVEVVGAIPPAGSCGGSAGKARLRFVLLDEKGVALTDEDFFGNVPVDLTKDKIVFEDSAVYSTPDVKCDGTCAETRFTCTSSSAVPAANADEFKRCLNNSAGTIAPDGQPKFLPKKDRNKLFGILMENTGSLSDGILPSDLANLSPDLLPSPDGKGDGPAASPNKNAASDPNGRRSSGFLRQFGPLVRKISDHNFEKHQARMYYGFWTFGRGLNSVQTQLTADFEWTSDTTRIRSAYDNFKTNSGQPVRSGVYTAIAGVIDDDKRFADPNYENAEKNLVVFTDGYDELRLDNNNVINSAKQRGVRVFIIHLDSAVPTTGADGYPVFRDDPEYIATQSECTSDDQCKNFEECRVMTSYSTAQGQNVDRPAPEKQGKNFCLPKRDDNGRVGPINDYAQIACETGGAYIYVPSPEAIQARTSWLPQILNGLWEVPVAIDAFADGSTLTPGEAYRLETNFTVTLNNQSQTAALSQVGGASNLTGDAASNDQDSRPVLFSAP